MNKLALILAFFVTLPAWASGSQSDDVSWVLPTTRVDDTPLPVSELAYTQLEVSRDGTILSVETIAAPGVAFTWNRELPPNYTLCYRARVADTEDQLSDWTGQVCKTVKGRPNPPSQLDSK